VKLPVWSGSKGRLLARISRFCCCEVGFILPILSLSWSTGKWYYMSNWASDIRNAAFKPFSVASCYAWNRVCSWGADLLHASSEGGQVDCLLDMLIRTMTNSLYSVSEWIIQKRTEVVGVIMRTKAWLTIIFATVR